MEGVLQAECAEQRIDGEELPEEYPVGDLAEESHDRVAENGGQPGRFAGLEGNWRHHGGRDDRIER